MSNLPISDYALLSDCRSAALVSRAGSVDWLCFPRFDAPSVFARILDEDGGHWSVSVPGAYVQGNGIKGTSQLVIDDARRVVVGATFTGPGLQELLHAATVAVVTQASVERLWHAVPSFPTVSEVWLHLLEAYGL